MAVVLCVPQLLNSPKGLQCLVSQLSLLTHPTCMCSLHVYLMDEASWAGGAWLPNWQEPVKAVASSAGRCCACISQAAIWGSTLCSPSSSADDEDDQESVLQEARLAELERENAELKAASSKAEQALPQSQRYIDAYLERLNGAGLKSSPEVTAQEAAREAAGETAEKGSQGGNHSVPATAKRRL